MVKIHRISLKLNFSPNTLGYYGLLTKYEKYRYQDDTQAFFT